MKGISTALASAALLASAMTCLVYAQAPAPAAPPAAGGAAVPGGPGGPAAAGAQGGAGRGAGGAFEQARGGGGRGGARGPAGPPAPVPPEVAIMRPSGAEVIQINEAIARLIDADKSPSKTLLEKYRSLTVVQPPRDNSAIRPTQRAANRHDAFVEIAKKGNIDLLLDGDSITDLWQNGASKEIYDKYFGQYKTANFAISGDTTQGVLWGLQNGEGTGFQPKAIMLMIGTNNSGGNTGPEIAEGVGAIVLTGPGKIWLQSMPLPILAASLSPYLGDQGGKDAIAGGAVGGMLGNILR